jgi:16S rRNA (uracil1498-N3)-methyltransferase
MISACEQSKQFVLPELCEPVKFENISAKLYEDALTVYFDPAGTSFVDLLQVVKEKKPSNIVLFFGPEGGLTSQEEKVLTLAKFKTYALTPTILRAREAVIVGLGGVRSIR